LYLDAEEKKKKKRKPQQQPTTTLSPQSSFKGVPHLSLLRVLYSKLQLQPKSL